MRSDPTAPSPPERIAAAARSQSLPLALMGAAGAALAFLLLAAAVSGGSTAEVDAAILRAIRSATGGDAATGALRAMMLDFTALGDSATLTLVTVAVTGYCVVARRWGRALAVAGAVSGGALLVAGLKLLFDRARPSIVTQLAPIHDASFPSGHAANSAVVYLTLGVLLARAEPSHRLRIYFVTCAILLTLGVGSSRVYLGVHWPSDVLGGWIFGAGWAALTGLAMRRLERIGAVPAVRKEA